MKRAKDRWNLLLIIGVVAVSLLPQIETLKATSLIFRTTTTTTTEEPILEEGADTEGFNETTTPASNLTGNPQQDYIHDPNLPRELNGFNLSTYPFYETVPPPDEMDFKCDGLHDGFYASVPHKCQVYHHCLYGTRYDFLCANYTAFDQKTFICHFASEVDCVNSPKYFHRNDDLYWENKTEVLNPKTNIKAAIYSKSNNAYTSPKPKNASTAMSTSTAMPSSTTKLDKARKTIATPPTVNKNSKNQDYDYNEDFIIISTRKNDPKFKTRNEALYKATTSSTPATTRTTTTTTTTTTPAPQRPRPAHRPRRPSRRRRPQYDYYDDDYYPAEEDDYYEEDRRPYEGRSGGRRRKRPRPRRPAYDDEYEDDRYERKPDSRTRYDDEDDRRPYERPRKAPARRPSEDRDQSDDRKRVEEDDRPSDRNRYKKPEEKRPSSDYDKRPSSDYDKRPSTDYDKRPYESEERRAYERPKRPLGNGRRPLREESEKSNPKDDRNFRDERPPRDRSNRDDRRDPPRNERRPIRDDFYDDEDEAGYSEEKETPRKSEPTAPSAEGLVKPVGGSLFSKPRIPPRIARPVPNSEKEKYKYITAPSAKVPSVKTQQPSDEEYYDDYEDEPKDPPPPPSTTKPTSRTRAETEKFRPSLERTKSYEPEPKRASNFKSRRPDSDQDSKRSHYHDESSYEDFEEPRSRRPSSSRGRGESSERHTMRKAPSKIEDEYYYDDDLKPRSSKDDSSRAALSKFRETPLEDERLQSKTERAPEFTTHKPFFQRNRNQDFSTTTTTTSTTTTPAPIVEKAKFGDSGSEQKPSYVRVVKRPFLPSRGGSPYLPRGLQPLGGKNFNKTTATTTVAPTTTTTASTTTTTTTTTENIIQQDYSYESDYDPKEDSPTPYRENTSQENYETKNERIPLNYKDENKEERKQLFLNAQKYNKDIREFPPTSLETDKYSGSYSSQEKYKNPYDRLQTFKPSPQISEPYKPTNRPFPPKIPENISIKQNLADSVENDYDVTLNDALNPTISNLPQIRSYPSPFIVPADRDYTFARFRAGYHQPDSSQASSGSYPSYVRPQQQQQQQHQQQESQRYQDSAPAQSELVSYRRVPQAFSVYSPDDSNVQLRPGHHQLAYRQVFLGSH